MNRIAQFVADHTLLAAMILLFSTLAATYLVGEVVRDRLEQERLSGLRLDVERRGIELMAQTLNGNQMGAIGLLGLIDVNAKQEARNERAPNGKDATTLMENIARAHQADGSYIVGQDGIVKSSWGVGKPLTGVDVKFRPYTQMALQGKENVYAAIGTTTGRRNLYYAAPLYAGSTKESPVIGAVVIRTGVVELDKLVAGTAGTALLLSPQGVAFSASREEWIGRVAGKLTPERIGDIRQFKQFGTLFDHKDPDALPFAVEPGITAVNGVRYAIAQARVNWNDPYGDWTLVAAEDLSHTVSLTERLRAGLAGGCIVFVIGWMLLHLLRAHYRQGLAGIQLAAYSREQQENAQRKARLAGAGLRLQQAESVQDLAQTFLSECHAMFRVLQGIIYVRASRDAATLRLAGTYACTDAPPSELTPGQGLLGQCAIEWRTQVIDTTPDGFGTIRSGLGESRPTAVMIIPMVRNDALLGVIEVALLSRPNAVEREQFEEIVGLLAMNLEILGRSAQTEEMLAATMAAEQINAEQLAFQQALVDTIPYPVFTKGADTRFVGVNRAYEETFNIKRQDLVGKRVIDLEFLPEADRMTYQTEDESVVAGAGTIQRDLRLLFADGKLHDTLYFVSGFRRADGHPGGLVGTFIDVSQIKNAEHELERLADAERFNKLAQGREQRIIELKREVNACAEAAGRPAHYTTVLVDTLADPVVAAHPHYRSEAPDAAKDLALEEMVDLAELQTLFSTFCEALGIAAAIIDLDGTVLAAARWQRACTEFHRVNADSCARCIESDTELALKLQDGQEFTMYKCKNGMTDCAAPIIVEGRHLANVFIGQFHLGPPDMEFFRRQARQFAYPEAEYLQAITEAPVVDEQRLPVILGFLVGFARMISTTSLARRRADAAQQKLQEQAQLLRRERLAAMSLAEDNAQARLALAQETEQQR